MKSHSQSDVSPNMSSPNFWLQWGQITFCLKISKPDALPDGGLPDVQLADPLVSDSICEFVLSKLNVILQIGHVTS
jgi:hypothetical protein